MTSKEVQIRFKELSEKDKFICDKSEFDDFVAYGYILVANNKYMLNSKTNKEVNVIDDVNYSLNINLQNLIDISIKEAADTKLNKIYCLTKSTISKYKEKGNIVEYKGKQCFRMFEGEYWLVHCID